MARFSRIDAKSVSRLQPGQSLFEHGIKVERLPDGDLRFSINIMADGRRIHRVLGRESEGVRRATAERLIEKLKTDARMDRLNLPEGRKLFRTLGEAAEEYLLLLEASGGKDLLNKKRHFRQQLVPALGKSRLDKLTTFQLQQYRHKRKAAGAAEATINRELSSLSHLLNRAATKDWGWLRKEDVPEIPKAAEARKQIRILTPEERGALLTAAAADQDPRVWLFTMFGLNAVMRHGEIVARRYDEVDFENCFIWIDRAKAGERQQPITPALRDALKHQRAMEDDPNGWIFPKAREFCKTPHRPDMREPFARVVKRAGLDPKLCTPHIMRHSGISALVMAKTDIPTIQKISGHKTPAMVLHYVHLFGQHISDAISVLNVAMPQIAETSPQPSSKR